MSCLSTNNCEINGHVEGKNFAMGAHKKSESWMRIELPVPGSKERTQPVNLRQRIEYYRAYPVNKASKVILWEASDWCYMLDTVVLQPYQNNYEDVIAVPKIVIAIALLRAICFW